MRRPHDGLRSFPQAPEGYCLGLGRSKCRVIWFIDEVLKQFKYRTIIKKILCFELWSMFFPELFLKRVHLDLVSDIWRVIWIPHLSKNTLKSWCWSQNLNQIPWSLCPLISGVPRRKQLWEAWSLQAGLASHPLGHPIQCCEMLPRNLRERVSR